MPTLTEARLTLLRRRIAESGGALSGPADETRPDTRTETPALFGQFGIAERRMWKIYELDPESVSHNIGLVLEFGGSRTVESVVAAAELLVERFEVLRSVVEVDDADVPHRVQVQREGQWDTEHSVWSWGFEDVADESADTDPAEIDPAEIDTVATRMTRTPFDLFSEVPLRLRVSGRDGEVTMILVVHHLAVDDTSWPLLLGTLVSGEWAGDADADSRPATPDAAAATEAAESAVRHALSTWAAEDVRHPLSGELPAESAAESWLSPMDDRAGLKVAAPVADESLTAFDRVAQTVGATPNALLIGVCSLAAYALTGASDHVLVVPADNRRRSQSPHHIGYCGNIIPVRFRVDPTATVEQTLRTAAAVIYRAMEHSGTDFGPILTALRQQGGRFPIMEIMASVRPAPLRGIPQPDHAPVTCRSVFNGIANYPLSIAFEADDHSTHVEVDHQPGIVPDHIAVRSTGVLTALVDLIPAALDGTVAELLANLERRVPA
ncbi:condensation domain-containing protein [Gordonia alkanivorans]|uniref:condensation domain-containing protein n=1 Tax=Gordonia alkanivorans TaxID=84096 RepID=UPI00244A8B2D|nr:condensation domain-containing protein [Gordonia alkanivorans]MDH3016989.1 condensation domain-containing protein [Gordonia alkanivorans]MDH3042264.1 condensation domain-containing protein [Gordonia alkanivorans]MDH3057786.1 condensation domain-containing protein [Gordonia alkanivorans]